MHEMQTVFTDDRGVCLSVCLLRGSARRHVQCIRGHSMQPLPNHFGLLLIWCRLFEDNCSYILIIKSLVMDICIFGVTRCPFLQLLGF